MSDYDLILVGGGLSTGLIAERMAAAHPDRRTLIVEAQPTLGGNHTWSFHQTDVSEAQDRWLTPFLSATWPDQEVRFPGYRRRLDTGYRAISSERFHAVLTAVPGLSTRLDTRVDRVETGRVVLEDGTVISGDCVIDGRGATDFGNCAIGYQTFVGHEVRMRAPHGLARPIIMDATVEQIGGYRFIYCLPFTTDTMLIEDTYYADTPAIDDQACAQRIEAYAKAAGWQIAETLRTERGILPIMLDASLDEIWPTASGVARSGMRAGLFHQTTGYSLPLAAHVAEGLAAIAPLDTATAAAWIHGEASTVWRRQSYFRLLNRVMFIGARPAERRQIFERFYTLSRPLIERFYAGKLHAHDKIRLLTGRPPIPMRNAFLSFPPSAANGRRKTHPVSRSNVPAGAAPQATR